MKKKTRIRLVVLLLVLTMVLFGRIYFQLNSIPSYKGFLFLTILFIIPSLLIFLCKRKIFLIFGTVLFLISFAIVFISSFYFSLKPTLTEQDRIEKAIENWIKENSYFPNSYESMTFDGFIQTVNGIKYFEREDSITEIFKDKSFPIGKLYRNNEFRDKLSDVKYAYYFIGHKYKLRARKNNRVDTIFNYFQLTPYIKVCNVRLENELEGLNSEYDFLKYKWREKYGNSLKNLELETMNQNDSLYIYRLFDWNITSRIIGVKNGKKHGFEYILDFKGDTIEINMFEDGVKISTGANMSYM
jgi:hypothetical protein